MVQELPLAQRDSGSNGHPRKQKEILTDSESEATLTSTEEKKRSKRKQNSSQLIPTSSSAPNSEPVNLAQDSDEENSKAKKKEQRCDPEFNDSRVFFSEPFRRKEDPENKPAQTYTFKTHQKREEAITAGAKLPLLVFDEEKVNIGRSRGTITNHFAPTEKFDNQTFNQIITLWLLRQAIPWSRVEDPYLQAVFHYCEAGANLFRQNIPAGKVHYVCSETTNSGSNNNTMAEVMHKKLCDLGGSTELDWNYTTMHIKCSCHKMVLVVNAGLNELGVKAPPPPKLRREFLGAFPYSGTMEKITEEEEEEDSPDNLAESDKDSNVDSDDLDDEEEEMEEEEDDEEEIQKSSSINKNKQATNRNQSNELNELTKAVCSSDIKHSFLLCPSATDYSSNELDFVVKKITSSCVWRQEFERRVADFDQRSGTKKLKGLIAGYGIRWNIKYQIESGPARQENRKENCKKLGHFNEIQSTAKDWMLINELNRELKPFNCLTKIMEGDRPTGAFVLPNYYQTISNLKTKEAACDRGHALHPMFVKMIDKLKNIFDLFNTTPTSDKNKELEAYTKNIDQLPGPTAKDPNSVLVWWKDHSKTYPVLALLAKDYLASSASSCAAKRTFSSAADVCSSGRGSLKPRTIERCVSSHMWLKEGIQVTGSFVKAQSIVTAHTNFIQNKK
ncbi:hypothetical protein MJO28_010740 [Puccinia striiformis f. sp. tritici]|uniref:Uncharacterized protein n=1 Tax=Puccinia striiformis f. sp. tritici TaxID=168172 RepID=A0ACC0E5C7_9BASI|nr:hypothetical protein MJO28_010740 [Puccinia striiformis f. sp. tritici]